MSPNYSFNYELRWRSLLEALLRITNYSDSFDIKHTAEAQPN